MSLPPSVPDFELLRRIGGGSYGDVWLARSVTGLYRAVKIVDRNRFKDSRPFLREFEGIKRFQQQMGQRPRQLALLHVGRDEEAGLLYYVMELADDVSTGGEIQPDSYVPFTLKELRARRTAPSANECIRIGAELAEALAELHEAGLIHRDVKPSNIIFVNGVAKLADLGLIASSEHTLTSLGTPGYSPPEGSGTVRADLYSLGRILYELMAGLPPEEFPRLPSSMLSRADAPALLELNEVILKAGDPSPENRYASAQAMVDDLRLIQGGRSLQELNQTKRRLRLALRFGCAIGLMALVGMVFLGIRSHFALRQLAALEASQRQAAERNERFARYTSDLNLAQLSLTRNNYGNARTALRRHLPQSGEPDLRDFEWYALWNASAGDQAAVYGSPGGPPVTALVLDPAHAQFAAQEGDYSRETVVWDLTTGIRRSVEQDTLGLGSFSSDGRELMIGTPARALRKIGLGATLQSATQPMTGRMLCALNDGRTVLLGQRDEQGDHFHLWDTLRQTTVASWSPAHAGSLIPFSAAAVSPNHQLLALSFFSTDGVSTRHDIQVVNFETGEVLHLPTEVSVHSLAFSPNNRRLAIGLLGRPTLLVSLESGAVLAQLTGHQGLVACLEYSPDGKRIASGGWDQTIFVWNAQSGALERTLRGHEGAVQVVRWMDSIQLISGSADGTCRRWALDHAAPQSTREGLWTNSMGDAVFSPDGTQIAATLATGTVGILNTTSLEVVREFPTAFQPLAFGRDGRSFSALSFNGQLMKCDIMTGKAQVYELALKPGARLTVVTTSKRGDKVVFGDQKGNLVVWDLVKRTSLLQVGSDSRSVVVALGWAVEDDTFAVGYRDGLVELRTVTGSVSVIQVPKDENRSLAFSPDGKFLAIGRVDGRVLIWDRKNQQTVANFSAHNSEVMCVLFTPDNARLITGGLDGFIQSWTYPPVRPVVALPFEEGASRKGDASLYRLQMTDDGGQLLGLSEEGRLRIWRATK